MPHLTTRSLVISIFVLLCASMLSLNLLCTSEEAGNNAHVHVSEFYRILEEITL